MYYFEPLTAFLDNTGKNFRIPACELLIHSGGKEIYRHGAGFSDREGTVPVSSRDLYWIYSATKISTCTAAMRLVEEGIIGIDDPVSDYLPGYAKLTVKKEDGAIVPAKNVMTIRHLMSMSGGLDYDNRRGFADAVLKERGEKAQTVELADAYAGGPLLFEPGTGFRYSLCHDVLGAVIEVASGMRFSEYLEKTIFAPLGMKDTTFHPNREQLSRVSALYHVNDGTGELDYVGNQRAGGPSEAYESGGGGLLSSVDDYILLADALANNGTARNGYQLLKPETMELFCTPQLNEHQEREFLEAFRQMWGYSYALGVRVFQENNGSTANTGHFGWDGAAGFYVLIDPEKKLSIIYAQDVLNSSPTFHLIHNRVRDLVYLCMRE